MSKTKEKPINRFTEDRLNYLKTSHNGDTSQLCCGVVHLTMIILMVCFGTVARINAGDAYNLNGQWDAVWDTGGYGSYQDVIQINQNNGEFVGVYLLKGDYHLKKGDEKVKGKLKGKSIDEVFLKDVDPVTFELYWVPSQGSISKEDNEIVIKHVRESKGAETVRTLSLKKK